MKAMLDSSTFFGAFASILFYLIGMELKRRYKLAIFNPLIVAIAGTILVVALLHLDYPSYSQGMKIVTYLLTPSTVCFAVPLYDELALLRKNWKAVFLGILSGVLACMVTLLAFAVLFRLGHTTFVTMLPKSITTAIGIGLSEELGGNVSITVAGIIITGVFGSSFAETFCRLFKIEEPIAKGVACGTAAHATGTAAAMEMGEVEGAMASLSVVVAGILTVAAASVFAGLY